MAMLLLTVQWLSVTNQGRKANEEIGSMKLFQFQTDLLIEKRNDLVKESTCFLGLFLWSNIEFFAPKIGWTVFKIFKCRSVFLVWQKIAFRISPAKVEEYIREKPANPLKSEYKPTLLLFQLKIKSLPVPIFFDSDIS